MSSISLRIESPGTSSAPAARILIADSEALARESLARQLRSLGYHCDSCPDAESGLAALGIAYYDLLITDTRMPGNGGVSLVQRANEIAPDTAVILISSILDLSVAVEVLKHGAYDYIAKPFTLEHMTIAVARALEKRRLVVENRRYRIRLEEQIQQRREQLQEALKVLQGTYHSTLVALGTAMDSRDAHTGLHSLRVTCYSGRIARELGVGPTEQREIEQGSLLHDIGKIGLPDELLLKHGKLSESEWALMRRHPEIGFRILSGIKFLKGAAGLVLQHHERYDGSGYPAGMKKEEISLGARIFAVADTLDCMTSERPFQAPWSLENTSGAIKRQSGSLFDPQVVRAFESVPLGEWKEIRRTVADARTASPFTAI